MSEEELTAEELEAIEALGLGAPSKSEKRDMVAVFKDIIKTKDTLKVANLDVKTELFPVRTLEAAAAYCKIMELPLVEKWLKDSSEILLGSSLSKNMAFINAMITSKQEKSIGNKKSGGDKKWWQKNQPQES